MTDTTPQQPANPQPTTRERITHYWHRARTPLRTAAASAGIWLATGALQELGTHLIEWLC